MTFHGDYSDSSFTSDYYPVFQGLGYPQCDLTVFEDGSWSILEMLNAPLVADLTQFRWIAKNLKHREINESSISAILRSIDPRNPEFWAKEIAKSVSLEDEKNTKARGDEDWVERIVPQLMQNEALRDRIARFGVRELSIDRIALAIAKESPSTARKLGINITQEHVPSGARHKLV